MTATILTDHGGRIGDYLAVLAWLKANGVGVAIKGICVSACMFLSLLPHDQVCVYPSAWIGYHTAPGEAHDTIAYERGSAMIARGMRRCNR